MKDRGFLKGLLKGIYEVRVLLIILKGSLVGRSGVVSPVVWVSWDSVRKVIRPIIGL